MHVYSSNVSLIEVLLKFYLKDHEVKNAIYSEEHNDKTLSVL